MHLTGGTECYLVIEKNQILITIQLSLQVGKVNIVEIHVQQSPSYKTLPSKGHDPSYQARFQMHRDNKILLNCPPPPKRHHHKNTFSFVEWVAL